MNRNAITALLFLFGSLIFTLDSVFYIIENAQNHHAFLYCVGKRYITWYVPVVQYYVHTNCTILMHIYAIAPSVMVCTFYYIFVAYVPAKKLAP